MFDAVASKEVYERLLEQPGLTPAERAGVRMSLAECHMRAGDGAAARRHYLYAWGLAYYLTFEHRLLGSPALDRYVAPDARAVPPQQRFERLVGTPLEEFEPAWRKYIRTLD